MSPKSIVLVQAGNDSLPRLRTRLEAKGYNVVQATDAPTALDLVNRSEIVLVVTELYLRLRTCRCLARVMGRSPALRRTKLLAYTTHGKRQDRDWARRIGADGYVKKRSGEELSLGGRAFDDDRTDAASLQACIPQRHSSWLWSMSPVPAEVASSRLSEPRGLAPE